MTGANACNQLLLSYLSCFLSSSTFPCCQCRDEEYSSQVWQGFAEDLTPLAPMLKSRVHADTGKIAARPRNALHQPLTNGVTFHGNHRDSTRFS